MTDATLLIEFRAPPPELDVVMAALRAVAIDPVRARFGDGDRVIGHRCRLCGAMIGRDNSGHVVGCLLHGRSRDHLFVFLDVSTKRDEEGWIAIPELFRDYPAWCRRHGATPIDSRNLARILRPWLDVIPGGDGRGNLYVLRGRVASNMVMRA